MAKFKMLECDDCGAEAREDSAINWIEVNPAGIDARASDEPPVGGLFCSRECASEHLRTTKKGVDKANEQMMSAMNNSYWKGKPVAREVLMPTEPSALGEDRIAAAVKEMGR